VCVCCGVGGIVMGCADEMSFGQLSGSILS